ncbi:hypothetical protein [Ralstonia solanacearum]|uniref:Uncharacterized protein n=1 Tax=Ralstonia solanacearum TaxID=305 RepID=A0AAE3T4V7_RALSL|nr:hypothetical protein [Ralstonia solanacearum]KFX29533.1 hypothetical protein KR96_06160 [Ralstonia solanacearum]MBB6583061.1 hypothetical protein [Ralstonia solanacearum]MDB0522882.1 hypothetical protein [Ralstonia solanacearum]
MADTPPGVSLLLADLPDFRCPLRVIRFLLVMAHPRSAFRGLAARGASALLDCVYGEVFALDGKG